MNARKRVWLRRAEFIANYGERLVLSPLNGYSRRQILIATHHKALTVYLRQVFSHFATLTGRTRGKVSRDKSTGGLGYSADVVFAQHSDLNCENLKPGWVGIHVSRDPRDMLVSACDYHKWSKEPWLHKPRAEFGQLSYQQKLLSLEDEDQIRFELDHTSGRSISEMLAWDRSRQNVLEVSFDELVTQAGAIRMMREIHASWELSNTDMVILSGLLMRNHIEGYRQIETRHVQNARPRKWKSRLSDEILQIMDQRFPLALHRLGFSESPQARFSDEMLCVKGEGA